MRKSSQHPRRRMLVLAAASAAAEAGALWLRSGRLAGRVPVRCRQGHVFTTLWIPGASLKALRLGWWRAQRCPVGGHWSIVTPLRAEDLTEEERRSAAASVDLPIP